MVATVRGDIALEALGTTLMHEHVFVVNPAACHVDAFAADVREQVAPNWHHLHITRDVLPALRANGVTDDQIHLMLVENPRRIFSVTGAY